MTSSIIEWLQQTPMFQAARADAQKLATAARQKEIDRLVALQHDHDHAHAQRDEAVLAAREKRNKAWHAFAAAAGEHDHVYSHANGNSYAEKQVIGQLKQSLEQAAPAALTAFRNSLHEQLEHNFSGKPKGYWPWRDAVPQMRKAFDEITNTHLAQCLDDAEAETIIADYTDVFDECARVAKEARDKAADEIRKKEAARVASFSQR